MEQFKEIFGWVVKNLGWIVPLFLALFEFTPIKIHPLSSILKWLGKHFNSDIQKQISEVKTDVNDLRQKVIEVEKTVDVNEMDKIRWEILNFANSCRNGRRHTLDEFKHVIAQNTKYEELLKKTDTTNGVYEEEYKYILEIYHHCRDNNNFLK